MVDSLKRETKGTAFVRKDVTNRVQLKIGSTRAVGVEIGNMNIGGVYE